MQCRNCSAPVVGEVCQYCKTSYKRATKQNIVIGNMVGNRGVAIGGNAKSCVIITGSKNTITNDERDYRYNDDWD